MKKTALTLTTVAALAAASTAFAAKGDFASVDTDGNGLLSLEELTAVYPNINEEAFAQMDKDGDGGLSQEEFELAKNGAAEQ